MKTNLANTSDGATGDDVTTSPSFWRLYGDKSQEGAGHSPPMPAESAPSAARAPAATLGSGLTTAGAAAAVAAAAVAASVVGLRHRHWTFPGGREAGFTALLQQGAENEDELVGLSSGCIRECGAEPEEEEPGPADALLLEDGQRHQRWVPE